MEFPRILRQNIGFNKKIILTLIYRCANIFTNRTYLVLVQSMDGRIGKSGENPARSRRCKKGKPFEPEDLPSMGYLHFCYGRWQCVMISMESSNTLLGRASRVFLFCIIIRRQT